MFKPVNRLEKSLMRAAINPSHRPQFYRDLLVSEILIIQFGQSNLNIKNNVLQEDAKLRIQHLEKDGVAWLPIFSSLERLRQFDRAASHYLQFPARDFFEITRGMHVVLNPRFEYGKEFNPFEIAGMLDGSIFKPSQTLIAHKEATVFIGQPATYPHQLVKVLSEYFFRNPSVNRAYLVLFHNPGSGEKPHLLVGIDVSDNTETIFGDAGMIGSVVLEKNEFLDFFRLDDSEFSQHVINSTKPFYQKSHGSGNL
ncbi:MAG: enhanced serine sensitivity protein SseB C-terminal domain-containing protein [Chloroflexota bacterium]